VLAVWSFPRFWYSATDGHKDYVWLADRNPLPGWEYRETPLSAAAEGALAADRIVTGEFRNDAGMVVRVFSAKRYSEKEGDMFAHTPDRCWTSVGWKLEPARPDLVELNLHGIPLVLERRIFIHGTHRELVYFGALVGGQPLPYRLDQYLNIAARRTARPPSGIFGKMVGALDARFFGWPWKSFLNRRALFGPKQFIRVSTPLSAVRPEDVDSALKEFLSRWLSLVDYRRELQQWQTSR